METLHGIKVYLRVVENGSLSAAARALGTSTSAVSATLGRLEHKLGARLLDRTTRRLRVTPEGAEYYRRCKRIVADLKEAESVVGRTNRFPTGPLRISVPAALGRMWIIPHLPEFVRRYPGVQLELVHTDFVPYSMEGGLDLAVQIGELHDSRLTVRRLACVPYVICASPTYCGEFGAPLTPEDLSAHRCLSYRRPRDGRIWDWKVMRDGAVERITVDRFMTFNSNEAVTAAAAAGLGIANVAEYYARPYLDQGALVRILDEYAADGYTISVVFQKTELTCSKLRVFVDFLVEIFSAKPWTAPGPPAAGYPARPDSTPAAPHPPGQIRRRQIVNAGIKAD